jgi:hypothetical protein
MKRGLVILAKFKVFSSSDPEDRDGLLSWIITWHLAARSFTYRLVDSSLGDPLEVDEQWVFKLQNAWHIGKMVGLKQVIRHKLMPHSPSRAYEQFCKDNNDLGVISFTRLVLRGFIDTRARISIKEKKVFFDSSLPALYTWRAFRKKDDPIGIDLPHIRPYWFLDRDIKYTDIVVCMLASRRTKCLYCRESSNERDSPTYEMNGLWLLRPVEPPGEN